MKLDISEIYHQYITKIVIFALFTFKGQIRQPNVYKLSVLSFTKKRLPWKINLSIDTGIKLDKDDEREIKLAQVLDNVESDYMTTVKVTFTTPKKEVTLDIDLSDEERYEKYLRD
jgi:hypothetical protein